MKRVSILRIILALTGLVLTGRLFFIQVVQNDQFLAMAQSEQLKKYEIAAERGRIYVRDGTENIVPLVLNATLKTLYADPRYVEEPYATSKALTRIIGGDVSELADLMSDQDRAYVVLAKRLNAEKAEAISDLDLAGVGLQDATYRTYPERGLAAQLLGFTNDEGSGQYGVEGALDEVLSGEPGLLNAVTDVNGIPLTTSDDAVVRDASDGTDITLTIDRNVQRFVEQALARGVKKSEGKSGSAIVMDPNTGAVIAMANYPSYEPAKFGEVKDQSRFINGVVSTPYEVGSVMKALTMSAGLNEGVVAEHSTYYDAGRVQVEDRVIENAISIAPAERDMTEVIKQSLNTGVVHVLQEMGGGEINDQARTTLYAYLHDTFGLAQTTGIEQAAEAGGVIFPPTDPEGNNVRYANMTFGQGMTVTMLQLATAYSSIINGGTYYQPHLVYATSDRITGEATLTQPTALRDNVISDDTSAAIRRMMEAGVQLAGIDAGYRTDYRIGGKTGTSQKLNDDGTYSDYLEVGTFAGFGASDHPQYVVIVKVDEPGVYGYAGSVAARPIFAEISNWLINYYRISPVR